MKALKKKLASHRQQVGTSCFVIGSYLQSFIVSMVSLSLNNIFKTNEGTEIVQNPPPKKKVKVVIFFLVCVLITAQRNCNRSIPACLWPNKGKCCHIQCVWQTWCYSYWNWQQRQHQKSQARAVGKEIWSHSQQSSLHTIIRYPSSRFRSFPVSICLTHGWLATFLVFTQLMHIWGYVTCWDRWAT